MAQASLDELLAEASAPDTSLNEFCEHHLPELCKIRVQDVPFKVLDDIAMIIHNTQLHKTDWMSFVNELGITENRALMCIKLKSQVKEMLPLTLALTGPFRERLTLADVVKAAIKNQRLDVLREIKLFYESLLSYSYVAREPTAPEEESEDHSSQMFNEKYQKSHMNMDDKENYKKIDSEPVLIETEIISILILHADADSDVAEKFLTLLKNAGFAAKTLSHYEHLLMVNSCEVIPALISAVDFVVPIVSEQFITQIHTRNHWLINAFDNVQPSEFEDKNYEDYFSHNSNNHYIYQLILSQYIRNRCLNFTVRPVMVPELNRNRLMFDVLLMQSYKLWEKVPDFIEMLRKTKQLLNRMTAER